jgi:hypothetical protein
VEAYVGEALVSGLLAAARREVLGFFRSRDSFWLMLGFGLLGAAPTAVLAFAGSPLDFSRALDFRSPSLAAEVFHNYASLAEFGGLVFLAYSLASRSLVGELERGSWRLVRLSPLGVERALAGKAIGVAIVVAAVHGFAASLLMLVTPLLRRTPTEVVGAIVGVPLVAALVIPEGFAHPQGARATQVPRGLIRTISVLRTLVLLGGLALFFGPPLRPRPSFDAYTSYWSKLPANGPAFPSTPLPWLVAILWLLLTGIVLWRMAVRHARSF